jgi:hypothetical protein
MLTRDGKQTQGGRQSPAVLEVDIGPSGEQQPADFSMAPASTHVQRSATADGGEMRYGSP